MFASALIIGSRLQCPLTSSSSTPSSATIWAERDPHPLRYSHGFVRSSSASKLVSSRVSPVSSSLFSNHAAGSFGFLKPKFCQLVLASRLPLSPAPTSTSQPVFTKSSLLDHLPCSDPNVGSVVGPLFFFTCALSLGDLIHFHGFKYHLHDNDFQIYISSTNTLKLQTHISC